MNVLQIEQLIKSLGQHQGSIHIEGVPVKNQPLKNDGSDWLTLEPEPGVEMKFWAGSHVFEALVLSLMVTVPEESLYTGELPAPLMASMSQLDIKTVLGECLESTGSITSPEPVGLTESWDTHFLDPSKYPGVEVVVRYTEDLQVSGLLFEVGNRQPENDDALDIVRMPSKEALGRFVLNIYPGLGQSILDQITEQSASVAIPAAVNRQHGETWGDKNTRQKQIIDASDLRAAVDSNLQSLKAALLEGIATEAQFEQIRGSLHALNIDHGWYK